MIDKTTLSRVAAVARLKLTEGEIEQFRKELAGILETFEVLQKVDVKGVEPTLHPVPISNVLREDKPEQSLPVGAAMSNAEQKEGRLFKGPRSV